MGRVRYGSVCAVVLTLIIINICVKFPHLMDIYVIIFVYVSMSLCTLPYKIYQIYV